VLALEDAVSSLATEVSRLERELERADTRHQDDLAKLRASFRREVVVWQPPSQALEHQRSRTGSRTSH
jgi:hypothetical protein